jgi:hypothetical protein
MDVASAASAFSRLLFDRVGMEVRVPPRVAIKGILCLPAMPLLMATAVYVPGGPDKRVLYGQLNV